MKKCGNVPELKIVDFLVFCCAQKSIILSLWLQRNMIKKKWGEQTADVMLNPQNTLYVIFLITWQPVYFNDYITAMGYIT